MKNTDYMLAVSHGFAKDFGLRLWYSARDGFCWIGLIMLFGQFIAADVPLSTLQTLANLLGLTLEEHEAVLRGFVVAGWVEMSNGAGTIFAVASFFVRSISAMARAVWAQKSAQDASEGGSSNV